MVWAVYKGNSAHNNQGELVNQIQNNSPAERAGLKRGDVIIDINGAYFVQGFGVQKVQGRGAVAHDQARAVVGDAPAFSGVLEFLQQVETVLVVHDPDIGLPRQLDDSIIEDSDALTEKIGGKVYSLHDVTAYQFYLAERGVTSTTRTLVQPSVLKHQSLSEGAGVMRVFVDHLIGICRDARIRRFSPLGSGRRKGRDGGKVGCR